MTTFVKNSFINTFVAYLFVNFLELDKFCMYLSKIEVIAVDYWHLLMYKGEKMYFPNQLPYCNLQSSTKMLYSAEEVRRIKYRPLYNCYRCHIR